MLHKKSSQFRHLALISALVTAATPLVGALPGSRLGAQAAFPLPAAIAQGTTVNLVNGSSSTTSISTALKQAFAAKFAGTQVTLTTAPATAALQSVLDGKADLAAIARPLTAAERAQGLMAVPVAREKIAIIVNAANPFQGSLTLKQFADIFQGSIADWSQLGGAPGPIQLIDRPDASDLRQSFSIYSAFNISNLPTSSNAIKLGKDSTAAVAAALGNNGIGYAPVSQIRNLPGVRALAMHSTLPDNPKYPFSQPYLYVFKGPNPNPAAAAFLGFATAPEGQTLTQATLAGAPATAPDAANSPSGNGNDAAQTATKQPAVGSPQASSLKVGKLKAGNSDQAVAKDGNPLPALLPSLGGDLPDLDGKGGLWGGWGWLWGLSPLLILPLIWWIFRGMWSGDDQDRLGVNLRDPNLPDIDLPDATGSTALAGGAATGDPWAVYGREDDREAVALPANPNDPEFDAFSFNHPDFNTLDFNPPNANPEVSFPPLDGPSVGGQLAHDFADPDQNLPPEPNLVQKATGALSNLFSGSGRGAAIAGGAAVGGAAAWSTMSDQHADHDAVIDPDAGYPEHPGNADFSLDLPEFADLPAARVVDGATDVRSDLAGDRDLLDFSEPDPLLDFHLPDWLDVPNEVAPDPRAVPANLAENPTPTNPLGNLKTAGGSALAGGAAAVTGAGAAAWSFLNRGNQAEDPDPAFALDADFSEADFRVDASPSVRSIPSDNYIALLPRGPHWAYAQWQITDNLKQTLKQQGGQNLALRLYDVTNIDFTVTPAHSMQQFDCGDLAQDWHIPVPDSDRDYLVELGYTTPDNRWLMLVRSPHVHIPTH